MNINNQQLCLYNNQFHILICFFCTVTKYNEKYVSFPLAVCKHRIVRHKERMWFDLRGDLNSDLLTTYANLHFCLH